MVVVVEVEVVGMILIFRSPLRRGTMQSGLIAAPLKASLEKVPPEQVA